MYLLIKSDSPEVYIAIWDNNKELAVKKWEAKRELSVQILDVFTKLCSELSITLSDIDGVIVYEGPGSYTGLRISISVANSIGYSNNIPVVGSSGDDWIIEGTKKLATTQEFSPISPVYGGEVYTTKPKK
jgi:tRNA threonylcarbamoyladenosine biosynthesis protein TsaB